MATITHPRTLDVIEGGFSISNFADVHDYLRDRPDIAKILSESLSIIPRYFKENHAIILRVEDDPDEERRYIAAYIQSADEPDVALDNLHHLIEDWWMNQSSGMREEVLLSLDMI